MWFVCDVSVDREGFIDVDELLESPFAVESVSISSPAAQPITKINPSNKVFDISLDIVPILYIPHVIQRSKAGGMPLFFTLVKSVPYKIR